MTDISARIASYFRGLWNGVRAIGADLGAGFGAIGKGFGEIGKGFDFFGGPSEPLKPGTLEDDRRALEEDWRTLYGDSQAVFLDPPESMAKDELDRRRRRIRRPVSSRVFHDLFRRRRRGPESGKVILWRSCADI